MPDINKEFLTYLQGLTDLQALVGQKVYQDMARQEAKPPFVVFEEGSGLNTGELLVDTSAKAVALMTVIAYGSSRDEANQVAEAIRVNCVTFRGMMNGNLWVDEIHTGQYRDTGVDGAADDSQQHRFWTQQLFSIHHSVDQVKV